jgi:hypothetical protein
LNTFCFITEAILFTFVIDLLDPYNVLFFRKQLYFITSVDYIDDRTLYCQITAQRDLFWIYYGNFCNSKGTTLITYSQLGQDHTKHEDDWNKQDSDNRWEKEEKNYLSKKEVGNLASLLTEVEKDLRSRDLPDKKKRKSRVNRFKNRHYWLDFWRSYKKLW